ncbi:hypothetical protein AJ87_39875 [Rhizobium yanglingense]|nr:hypothetical protein AJ87_39875 [Rhizobium yanglingense]
MLVAVPYFSAAAFLSAAIAAASSATATARSSTFALIFGNWSAPKVSAENACWRTSSAEPILTTVVSSAIAPTTMTASAALAMSLKLPLLGLMLHNQAVYSCPDGL